MPLMNLVLEVGKDAVESAARVTLDKLRRRERFRRSPLAFLMSEARRLAAQPGEIKANTKPRRFLFPNEADVQRAVWAFRAGPDRSNGDYRRATEWLQEHAPALSEAQRDGVARRFLGTVDGELKGRSYRIVLEAACEEEAGG